MMATLYMSGCSKLIYANAIANSFDVRDMVDVLVHWS